MASLTSELRERGQAIKKRGEVLTKRAVGNVWHRMTMEKYVYTPLPSPHHIRLLKLQPATNPDTPSLSVELVSVLFDEVPEFEALSYVWGNPWPRYEVSCAGRRIDIGSSLYNALWHMRRRQPTGRSPWVWADAICINQADIAEREAQVRLMSEIYSRAAITVIWLGVENDHITRAFECLKRFHEAWRSLTESLSLPTMLDPAATATLQAHLVKDNNSGSHQLLRDAFGDDAGQKKAFEDIWTLLRQPWFMRKWVIQEVDKSKHHRLVFIAGEAWGHWRCLSYWVKLLNMSNGARDEFLAACPWRTGDRVHDDPHVHNVFERAAIMGQFFSFSLVDPISRLLITTATFQCTVPSDHIIALLGIASDSSTLEGLIDYNISTDDLYRRLTCAHLENAITLRILWSTLHMVSVERRRKSSWIPNIEELHSKFPTIAISNLTKDPYRLANAGGSSEIQATTSGNTLLVKGRIIDVVEKLGRLMTTESSNIRRPLFSGYLEKNKATLREWADWLDECQNMAEAVGQDEDGFTESVLIKNLSLGLYAETTAAAKKVFFKYRQYQKSLVAAPDEPSFSKIAESMDWEMVSSLERISGFIDHMQFRRFGCTQNGRLGWMPFIAEEGDQICVFEGMEFPYVVRQKEGPEGLGNYVLVGECYISSLLNGEAMELPGVESTIITIE